MIPAPGGRRASRADTGWPAGTGRRRGTAGFFPGGALEHLSLTIGLVLGGIAAPVIIGGIVLLRRRMAGLAERAGRAYPGPWNSRSDVARPGTRPIMS